MQAGEAQKEKLLSLTAVAVCSAALQDSFYRSRSVWCEGDRAQDARGPRMARDGHSRTGPMREKKVFFGDFLSPDKKLPAVRRNAEALL